MKAKSVVLSLSALAVLATPLVASAANPENTAVTATVGSIISMTGSTTLALSLTPTSGSVQSINSGTYTVSTNNSSGYNLRIKDSDATVNLVSGSNNITPGTGTQAAPVALIDGRWGWAVVGGGGAGQFDTAYTVANNTAPTSKKFAGVTASDVTFKTTATTAASDPTTVYYSAQVAQTQPTGGYTGTVVITATANP